MAKIKAGTILIGQSGGPTSVINASLAGVLSESRGLSVFGMPFGVEGFLEGRAIDLSALSSADRKRLKRTPSSALGSTRKKLGAEDMMPLLEELKKRDIRYLFMVGGNDTMDTIKRITDFCAENSYELTGVGIPKTVDNDLYGTDHTPGFPSAAWYNALSVRQAGVLARDMQRVDQFVVYQTVGRDAGWLAAATACGRQHPDDAPHLIYVPEIAFDDGAFLDDVRRVYEDCGWVSIVCGEGIAYADGTPVSASETKDTFNNVEFGAMAGASAAFTLHRMVSGEFGWRGEFQVTESLAMCAADRALDSDIQEAYQCGRTAVQLARDGSGGVMVTIERPAGDVYSPTYGTIPLSEVARRTKAMPAEFLDGPMVSQAFLDYMRALVPRPPDYLRLY